MENLMPKLESTHPQVAILTRLLRQHHENTIEYAWRGSQDPETQRYITAEYRRTHRAVHNQIKVLNTLLTPTPR